MKYRWDTFEIDVLARRLDGADGEVHVEPQVFDVLVHLIENRSSVVAKSELLDEVWGDQFVSDSAITTRIKQARRAIGDDGRTQKFIRNVHGRGYQFVGELVSTAAGAVRDSPPRLALEIAVDDEFPFVGRERELEMLMRFLGPDVSGSAQGFIGGSPGVGKSRLAVELLLRSAANGDVVCASRCEEHVRSALQPVRDCLAQLAEIHPERVGDWCNGLEGPLLSLMPSLVAYLPDAPIPIDTYAAIDAFVAVFDRISADAPVTILVDDLQWSDEPTRTFISRIHRRLGHRRVSIVCTYRSDVADLPAEVDAWIRGQPRGLPVCRIELEDLDESAALHLVAAVLGDNRGGEALASVTAGNCLFLTESLREVLLGQSAGGSVAELVAARVARQPANVSDLIAAAALLGTEFSFSTATAASGLTPVQALAAIGEAVEAGLLHETASNARFRFSHQLVPESIARAMSRQARALGHSRCADALVAEGGDEIEIILHRLRSAPLVALDIVVAAARELAASVVDQKQFDRAIPIYQRILESGVGARVRAEVLLLIGETIVARGTTTEAVRYFEEAADLARRNGWPDVLATAALGHWGRSPFRRPSDRSTLRLLAEANDALGPEPSLVKARILAKRAAFSVFTSSIDGRRAQLEIALAMAPNADGIDRMELLESQAIAYTSPAGIADLDRIDPELERLRVAHDTYFADAAAPETRLLMRGRGAEFRAVVEFDELRSRAQPIGEWRDAVLGSTVAAFAGNYSEAERLCNLGGAIGEPYWGESTHALHALGLLFIDSLTGEWHRSAEMLEFLVEIGQVLVLTPPLAWVRAATGDYEGARRLLARVRQVSLDRLGQHILGGNSIIAFAETALLLDDTDLVERAETLLLPYQDIVLGVPWACSFAAADTLSRLANRLDDREAAQAHRDRAATLYADLQAPSLVRRLEN